MSSTRARARLLRAGGHQVMREVQPPVVLCVHAAEEAAMIQPRHLQAGDGGAIGGDSVIARIDADAREG
jgi:hypothetical protein